MSLYYNIKYNIMEIDNLKDIDCCNIIIKKLIQEKQGYLDKVDCLNRQIEEIKNMKYHICSKKGHNLITEREMGPYGERFTYCTICDLEY